MFHLVAKSPWIQFYPLQNQTLVLIYEFNSLINFRNFLFNFQIISLNIKSRRKNKFIFSEMYSEDTMT